LATESCTYKDTSYADGDSEGQGIYGVTSDYQAKAAAHAVAIGPLHRTSSAWAAAGDTVIWGGKDAFPGRVKVPWVVQGTLTTQTNSAGPLGQTKADASVVVTIGLWDRTADTRDTEIVIDIKSEGQASKNVDESSREAGKKDEFTMNFVPGHKYTVYIKLEVQGRAEGQIKAPILGADAFPDFFSDGFGAKFESVTWELDMPDSVHVICNVTEA
jgi:hypothetical protein